MQKLKTIYFGTPDFSLPSLLALKNNPKIDLYKVVTMPDRPAGRGKKLTPPPVALFAQENNISLFQTKNINKETSELEKWEEEGIDLIVVLAFSQFLGKKILELPRFGCFNIHTSLLPKYRGAAPIQYALLNGDKSTGVSIQKMVKKMDAGDLVHSYEIPLTQETTGGELYDILKEQAAKSLDSFIDDLQGNSLTYIPQDEKLVSFSPELKKEDGLIDFKNSSFKKIKNQIRALSPWPGTYCYLGEKRLKVFSIKEAPYEITPGECETKFNSLAVGCSDSSLIITEVQLEGKKRCSDLELLNGLQNNKNFKFVINNRGDL